MSQKHECDVFVFINRQKFELEEPVQTGASLKRLAAIPLEDTLFLQADCDDDTVIANDTSVRLRRGDKLHSSPPANYGYVATATEHHQPDGWRFLVYDGFPLPRAYMPQEVRLLVKLPPLYPEAAPDMFWVSPSVRLTNGSSPRGTSMESLLGEQWQRFSWHLLPGAWTPGQSALEDFFRCIRGRLERKD